MPRALASSLLHGVLIASLGGAACRPRDDEESPAATSLTPPQTSPSPPLIDIAIVPAPSRTRVIHHVHDLGGEDLASIEHLDLALSAADLVGIVAAPDPITVCRGLDLRHIAERAPMLRSLRLSGCPEAANAGLDAFVSLETLHLVDLSLGADLIERVSQLTSLRDLTLTRVTFETDHLRPLAGLRVQRLALTDLERDSELSQLIDLWPKTLHSISLSGPWAGHKAMLNVAHAAALENIELLDTRVGNFSLNQLKGLPNLHTLTLSGATFNDNSPLYVRELPITGFSCDCPRFGDAGLRSLRHSKGLRRLELSQTHVTSEGLAILVDLHDLESVAIDGPDISGPGLEALASHRKLRRLDLGGPLEDPKMSALGDITSLTHLRLAHDTLDDRVAPQLAKLTHLESLDLSGTKVSDAVMSAIAGMTALRTLKLHHTRITHRGLIHLAPLHNLEHLELDHTDILDGGTEVLANLSNLRVLRLDHTLITDVTVGYLHGLRRLERLNLSGTVVSMAGVAQLQSMPALEVLGLEDTRATTRP